jgi:hypothetical protein
MRDRSDHHLGGGRRHLTGGRYAMTEPFDEELAIGIEHDFDNGRVVEGDAELVAESLLQFADKSGMGAKLVHHFFLTLLG